MTKKDEVTIEKKSYQVQNELFKFVMNIFNYLYQVKDLTRYNTSVAGISRAGGSRGGRGVDWSRAGGSRSGRGVDWSRK